MSWQSAFKVNTLNPQTIDLRLRNTFLLWTVIFVGMLCSVLIIGESSLYQYISTSTFSKQYQSSIKFITDYAMYPFYFLFLGILIYGYYIKENSWKIIAYAYLMAQLIGAGLIVRILKMTTGRARPFKAEEIAGAPDSWIGFTSNSAFHSFPSGHTADLFVSAIFVALLLPNKFLRLLIITFALCVGLTRILLHKHYPYDVITGCFIGAIMAFLVIRYWLKPQFAKLS